MFDQQVLKLQSKTLKEYDSRMQEDWYDLEMKSPRVIWRVSAQPQTLTQDPVFHQITQPLPLNASSAANFRSRQGPQQFFHKNQVFQDFYIFWTSKFEISEVKFKCDIYLLTCFGFSSL